MRMRLALFVLAVGMGGCSSSLGLNVRNDLFYPKKDEPRTIMDWFAGSDGMNHRDRFSVSGSHQGFTKLGGD